MMIPAPRSGALIKHRIKSYENRNSIRIESNVKHLDIESETA